MPTFTVPIHEHGTPGEPNYPHGGGQAGKAARADEYPSPGARAAAEGKVHRATPAAFKAALQQNTRVDTLTDYSLEDLAGMDLFLLEGGKAGYALKPGGELVNLFNNGGAATKGAGPWLVIHSVEQGARHGDYFDGFLHQFYRNLGFAELRREPNWTPGGPDVVYMRFAGGDPATARARYKAQGWISPTGDML